MNPLLYAGIAGPLLFIVVLLVAGATRRDYKPWRHFGSQLALGPGGWIQVANFLVCGLLVLLFAIGLAQTALAASIFLGAFAVLLIVAGIFPTGPVLGHPPGASEAPTMHGTIHVIAGVIAFVLLPVACFVMAWHFAGEAASGGWVAYSIVVGVVVLVSLFAVGGSMAMAQSGRLRNPMPGLFQRIAIITGWTWIAAIAWRLVS